MKIIRTEKHNINPSTDKIIPAIAIPLLFFFIIAIIPKTIPNIVKIKLRSLKIVKEINNPIIPRIKDAIPIFLTPFSYNYTP